MKRNIKWENSYTTVDDEGNSLSCVGIFRWKLVSRGLNSQFSFTGEFDDEELIIYKLRPIQNDQHIVLSKLDSLIVVNAISDHVEFRGFTPSWALYEYDEASHLILTRFNYLAAFMITSPGKYLNSITHDESLSDHDRAALWDRGLKKFVNENPGRFGHPPK